MKGMSKMKKVSDNMRYMIVDLEMFKCCVVFAIVKDRGNCIEDFRKIWKREFDSEAAEKDFGSKGSSFMKCLRDMPAWDNVDGEAFNLGNDVVVTMNGNEDIDPYVVVHEITHGVQFICRNRGVDDIETVAYMMEYLCRSIIRELYKWKAEDGEDKD